jgi:cytochrome b pre-mRNA-processing protein 6
LLLDNAFSRQFKLSEKMMKPESDPEHYEKLAIELDEAPDRGFFGRLMKRLGGMIRFK